MYCTLFLVILFIVKLHRCHSLLNLLTSPSLSPHILMDVSVVCSCTGPRAIGVFHEALSFQYRHLFNYLAQLFTQAGLSLPPSRQMKGDWYNINIATPCVVSTGAAPAVCVCVWYACVRLAILSTLKQCQMYISSIWPNEYLPHNIICCSVAYITLYTDWYLHEQPFQWNTLF